SNWRRLKDNSCAQQRRNEERHELAEDVAERHKRDEAERVKPALVFSVRVDAALEGIEIGQKVAVGEDHAAGLGSGAGSEENLRDVASSDGFVGERLVDGRRRLVAIVVSDNDI